jgi:hypothetical protein
MLKKNEMSAGRDKILGVKGMWRWVREENPSHQPAAGLIELVVLTVAIFRIGAILTSSMWVIWIAAEGAGNWTARAAYGTFF